METHWQRFKFLLRKKRKGMKAAGGKALRVLGALVLLATLFGPMPYRPTSVAEASDLAWGSIAGAPVTSAATAGRLLPLGAGTISDIFACSNGDVYVISDEAGDGDYDIFRSTNNGNTWTEVQASVGAAALPAVGTCSANYGSDQSIVTIGADRILRIFTANGTTAGAFSGALNAAGAVYNTVSTSEDFKTTGTTAGTVVLGHSAVAGALAIGSVVPFAGGAFGAQTLLDIGVGPGANAVVTEAAGDRGWCLASPNYSNDSATQCIASLTDGGAADGGDATTGVRFIGASSATLDADHAIFAELLGATGSAGIFLPTGYNAATSNNPRYVIALAGMTTAANDGIYRRAATGFTRSLNGVGTGSLAGMGADTTTCTLIAGLRNAAAGNGQVRTSGDCGQSFDDAKNLAGNIAIAATPDVAVTSNAMFSLTHDSGAADGNIGAIFRSLDGGGTWYATALTESDNALGTMVAFDTLDGSTVFLVTQSPAFTSESVWKGTGASGSGTTWLRVNRNDTGGTHWVDVIGVNVAPGSSNNTVYLLRNSTNDQVLVSTNGGNYFLATTRDPGTVAPTAFRVVDATTVLVADGDGYIWKTVDGGGTWTKSTTDLGTAVNNIVVDPDKNFWAAARGTSGNPEVYRSIDGGAVWTIVDSSAGEWDTSAATFNALAFDAGWASGSKFVYVAHNVVGEDIYRMDMSAATPDWQSMAATRRAAAGYNAIAAGNGVLYASENVLLADAGDLDGDANVTELFTPMEVTFNARTIQQTTINDGTARWGAFRADIRGAAGTGAAATTINDGMRFIAGSDKLYVLDGAAGAVTGAIRSWTNTTAWMAGPAITSPANNGTVPTNTGINGAPVQIMGGAVSGASQYHIQVALDAGFQTVICQSGYALSGIYPAVAATCGMAAPPTSNVAILAVGNLIVGQSYYARSRAIAVTIGGIVNRHDGPWGATTKFSVGSAGAPTAPEPSLPIDGSTLTGLGTNLSWNNPAGTTQVQVQVIPMNDDGPGINLIVNATSSYAVQAPVFGTGNYVMLPGATYIWRVRTSNSTGSISESDPSWGPWSDIRTFKTPKPNAGTIQLLDPIGGKTVTDKKPALTWKDANASMFYYEVQLSSDPNFGTGPQGAIAAVQHQLVHGAVASPPDSYRSPTDLAAGTYYWRIRQRVQATALGADEPGIAWSASQSFKVQ